MRRLNSNDQKQTNAVLASETWYDLHKLPQNFFIHFASRNQLRGFSMSGTLGENGLIKSSQRSG